MDILVHCDVPHHTVFYLTVEFYCCCVHMCILYSCTCLCVVLLNKCTNIFSLFLYALSICKLVSVLGFLAVFCGLYCCVSVLLCCIFSLLVYMCATSTVNVHHFSWTTHKLTFIHSYLSCPTYPTALCTAPYCICACYVRIKTDRDCQISLKWWGVLSKVQIMQSICPYPLLYRVE